MELDYEEIGRNLSYFRKKRHLKQAELAERVNVTAQHISHIECAKAKLSLTLIIRISEALDVSIYDLLGDNVPRWQESAVDQELSRELAGATVRQKKMILALSQTYLEHDSETDP